MSDDLSQPLAVFYFKGQCVLSRSDEKQEEEKWLIYHTPSKI